MKKYIFILMAVVLGNAACNDIEKVSKDFNSSSIASVSNTFPFALPQSNIDYTSISNYQGRLRFISHQDVSNTIQDLETQYNLWNTAFNQYYGDLPAEQLDSIDEAIQFNDELPAQTFESSLNFLSLRDNIEQQVSVWLADDELDEENDPDDHYIADDEYRTVLNPNSEIIVGDTIFKLYANSYIKIYDENGSLPTAINVADNIENGNLDPFDTTQASIAVGTVVVVVVFATAAVWSWRANTLNNPPSGPTIGTPTCDVKTMRRESDYKYNVDNDKRIKWVVRISNYPWGNNALARIKGYKKKKKDGWKKYKSDLQVRCFGVMREKYAAGNVNSCKATDPFDNLQEDKAKRLKAVGVYSGISTADKNDVNGQYNGAGGISHTEALDW